MGRYRERDAQGKDNFSGIGEINTEENGRSDHQGTVNLEGVDEAMEEMRKQEPEPSSPPESPETVKNPDEIDFEAIRTHANHVYFLNSNDHMKTPDHKDLELGISAHYEEMTDALMGYLEDDGVEVLHQYVSGELENETHWANLVGLGLVEGEQNLSTLGEYVTDQVFEYSD